MMRSRRRRLALRWLWIGVSGFGGLALLWVAGLLWFVAVIPKPGPEITGNTDGVVVLTGGTGRLEEGLRLLSAGRAKKLFVSGVYRGVDVAALLRLARQTPGSLECCIMLGYDADNTVGNARETASWMKAQGYRSLRLVTSSYHMPRSVLEFRRLMPDVRLVPHPVFPVRFKHTQWWLWPGTAGLIAREYNKYLFAVTGLSGAGGGVS
jgi:uncharacterized SAM-binding protein YcdF (DUF218 family)